MAKQLQYLLIRFLVYLVIFLFIFILADSFYPRGDQVIASSIDLKSTYGQMKGFWWSAGFREKRGMRWEEHLKEVDKVLEENKYLSGVLVKAGWNKIEKEKDKYDWSCIDDMVKLIKRHNKSYKLLIHPGVSTPDWVYNEGAKGFRAVVADARKRKYGERVRIPIPWDEIYLKQWFNFLEKVSQRYKDDKDFIATVLTGANFLSGEMHLPKTKEDKEQWKSLGNYKQKLVTLHKKLIDKFVQLFPYQQIAIHIARPIDLGEEAVDEILKYGVNKYPEHFTLQNCQLNGRHDNRNYFTYKLIMKYKDKVPNGFQSVSSFLKAPGRQGSTEMAVYNFIRADAEYWELLFDDGGSVKFCSSLQNILNTASKLGAERYKQKLMKEEKWREPRQDSEE